MTEEHKGVLPGENLGTHLAGIRIEVPATRA